MAKSFEEFLNSIKGKRISVVGIGISNTPVIEMFVDAGAIVSAYDKNPEDKLGETAKHLADIGVNLICGEHYLDDLSGDMILKTPGMRFDNLALLRAKENGSVITSEMELFFEYCPSKIIAVTGSDGKTTTTTLIYEMLKKAGNNVFLGGNIGKPLLPQIRKIKPSDLVVAELSSFQLHTMTRSADIAVVTNVSPNHLDMHKSMEEYIDAKKNIFIHQNENGTLIINHDNEITDGFDKLANGKVLKFSFNSECNGLYYINNAIFREGQKILDRADILLRGDHNVENYMAAMLAVWDYCEVDDMRYVANNFGGVRHRIELVRRKDGVEYYNDSIGSSPTRTLATLKSFDKKVILIAGGYDKHLSFDTLGTEMQKYVKALFLTGDTAEKIKTAVENAEGYEP
ncbi:MAG: UDP-N-acetylmuramoyl-L-alanine--D-glutamate ligase, partial [Alphaproteobacteria bacterium]|nr:UDP-N-acetylmuramoyl-L-alanine--D-glutamate ligase [Alphaproteobacteria bacterium]